MKNIPLVNTLKERISIVKMVKITSATGSPTETEEEVKSCRASMTENSGSEDEEGKVRSLFSTVFIIRYDNQFTKGKANSWFVKDVDGFKYNIISVVEKVRKKYLQINTIRRE